MLYDTSLENTLKNMREKNGFLETHENQERDWLWNEKPIKKLGGAKVNSQDKNFDFNDDIQNVLLVTSEDLLKRIGNEEKVIFMDLLETVCCFNRGPTRGQPSE